MRANPRAVAACLVLSSGLALGCHRGAVRTAPDAVADERLARIESILETQQREQHIPGLAFAVVKDDRVFYIKGLGLRDIERRLPATPDTLFPIGSCTKAFTSMAVGISQERGLLSLDDPPRKHLPWFKLVDPEADAQITLRDMLGHRTGLKAYADLAAEPAVLTREEYIRAATSARPAARFRASFQYSNAMYAAAGEILGKVHGTTWERVIERTIFGPLGMTSSIVSIVEGARAADLTTGYLYLPGEESWRAVPPPKSLDALAPGGSIASSARDMTRWLRMLLAGGRLEGRRLVSDAMIRELTTGRTPINETLTYALGWGNYDWNGLRVVEHTGGSQGISAVVSFIPERRAGFVFLANTSPNQMTRIGNAGKLLWSLILGEPGPTQGKEIIVPSRSAAPVAAGGGPAAAPAGPEVTAPAAELPPVDALLDRMIAAAGGEGVLRRHASLEMRAIKSYVHHGVSADLRIRARAPAMRTEEEVWTAAGREIGRVRAFFDGTGGGQETTFGQDSINDGASNDLARRDDTFHRLLELKRLYKQIDVESRATVGPEEAWVLRLTPAEGEPVRLHVSIRTGLVLKREAGGASMTFDDYRAVDGELVPFATTIHDTLGETTIRVEEIRFNTPIPDEAFAASVPGGK
jgi:CubicO group peptidase (beta-lactamase class C family)